ncbi:hypothetical protein SAMN06265371_11219 [Lutibacter agarilyticus]|uniref:Pectate lyase superfamily protein n=1 Tax=Lutibacter agarilyticus TaxID=1109740 RepID=A0A238Z1B9_9FLAO|nr:hypothetical protein [Lutibacter agarilyticus]SNR77136.1 hypothetical protein SAMN06265371_11219 [Lutibacter agarilyticus]
MKHRLSVISILSSILFCTTLYSQNNWDKAIQIVSELNPVTSFLDTTYYINSFGAKGDGETPCKEAFDKAVTTCSENGGGTIIVEAGDYYMNGLLVLKSNAHTELKEGAVFNFSSHESDYLPAVLTRWEGMELYNFSPLIYAYHVSNIVITGKGTINGNGSKHFASWKHQQVADKKSIARNG